MYIINKGSIYVKNEIKILAAASLALAIGTAVAYYNTSSFGYDNANIISVTEESVKIFDFDIKYEDIEKSVEKIKENTPKNFISV